ncbi:hypothetical protein FQR65_LT02534 [Abscondita terminalis]|nr:hypothetical protein FQR65_LT02534 [Abscondita terminalis]
MLINGQNMGKYFGDLYKKFDAPYFGIYLFNEPFLVVKDPNVLKHIQIKDFHKFSDKFIYNNPEIDPIFCNLMMTVKSNKWKFFRTHLSQTFTTSKLKKMINVMKLNGDNLHQYMKSLTDRKFQATFAIENYSTDVVSTTLFGLDSNSFAEKNNPLKHHALNFFPRYSYEAIKVYSYHFIHALVKLFKYEFVNSSASKFFSRVFTDVIKTREETQTQRDDLVDFLIDLKNKAAEEGLNHIDHKSFLGQAISFFIAGQETTTIILSCLLHELCVNIDIQERVRKEINEVLEEYGELKYESINQMKYLDMVISEALRKYPVLGIIQRKCIEDSVIPETNFKIERGTNIIVPIHGLLFDENYFPDPNKFDPERFSEANKHKVNPYVYQPFSLGPRNCIGKRFALLNMKIAVVYLMQKYQFELRSDAKITLDFGTSQLGHSKEKVDVICTPIAT